MKYLRRFENFYLITENPDSVFLHVGKSLDVSDGRPFAFDNSSDKVYIGNKGNYHGNDEGTSGLDDVSFPGRFWIDDKIISFWVYPKEEDFKKYIDRLEKQLHSDRIISKGEKIFNNGWQIEVIIKNGEKQVWDERYSMYMSNNNTGEEVLIPIEEYVGSEDVPEEQRVIHLMNSEEKRKALLDMGYKPKTYPTPKGWSQAQTRNKKTRFRFTESFDSFEDKKWSVKRYGNSHAVFYDGQIVGFDDKEIGDEFNVESELFNVELIYSIDEKSEEILPIYVCKNVWKIFDLVDQFDISPAVKQIAQKMAEKMYRQGFYIRVI